MGVAGRMLGLSVGFLAACHPVATGTTGPGEGAAPEEEVPTLAEGPVDTAPDGWVVLADSDADEVVPDLPADTAETATPVASDTGPAGPTVVDCAAPLPSPVSKQTIAHAYGTYGLALDAAGYAYGMNGTDLMKAAYGGPSSVLVPGYSSAAQQIDVLPNQDLVVANNASGFLERIDPSGQVTPITYFAGLYGVRVGPDGQVYVAGQLSVSRVDPDTGTITQLLPPTKGFAPRAVEWSPDLSTMYVASASDGGLVHAVPVDAAFNPAGPLTVLASTNAGFGWHDGLGVDLCGNLYLPELSTRSLYRITPSGVVTTLFSGVGLDYGHGLVWGRGVGGWREDAIYLPQPFHDHSVREVVLGLPARDNPNYVALNLP